MTIQEWIRFINRSWTDSSGK